MNMLIATEKIQKFFGLNESDDFEPAGKPVPKVQESQPVSSSQKQQKVESKYSMDDNQPSQRMTQAKSPKKIFQKAATAAQPMTQTATVAREKNSRVENEPRENTRIPEKIVTLGQNERIPNPKNSGESSMQKISIVEPRTYTESKAIAQSLFREEAVIINFHLVEEEQARRIIDFLTGIVYAIDGDIQRISGELFICTPKNMEIDSATAQSLLKTQFRDY